MAKRLNDLKELRIERPPKVKLSAKESLKRTQDFDKRKQCASRRVAGETPAVPVRDWLVVYL